MIEFPRPLLWSKARPVMVLGKAAFYSSEVVHRARKSLADVGIHLRIPPPYSTKLKRIEPVFRQIKH